MLAISFFALIFSSLVWLILSFRFISDNLGTASFFSVGIAEVAAYLAIICLPIFLAWLVFSYANQYLQNRKTSAQLQMLFGQMKKNQDYSDLLARIMIETEQQVKDGFMLNRFDLLIADVNELLAEIIQACKIASPEQIERLWAKVQNGGKWSFGKVIIEVNNAQPNFQMRVYEKANRDTMLGGAIMEFCARYQALITLLEKHDHDKTFLNMIETGIMGKTYSIFAPISDEIRKSRESATLFTQQPQSFAPVNKEQPSFAQRQGPKNSVVEKNDVFSEESVKPSFLNKVAFFKKKEEPQTEQKDPFSQALERSFGTPPFESAQSPRIDISNTEDTSFSAFEEPRFDISTPEEEDDDEPHHILQTQQHLDSLKKEWGSLAAPSVQQEEDDNFAYPFGNWTDEQNYDK